MLCNITEQSLDRQKELVTNFIDFKKAFDSVHRTSLWQILEYYVQRWTLVGSIRRLGWVGLKEKYCNFFHCISCLL